MKIALFCSLAYVVSAQDSANPAMIKEGSSLFRANCSPCHGLGARGGGRGPDLTTGQWTHGGTDAEIFRTISQGVPGTEMPAHAFEDSEIQALVAYLRSVGAASTVAAPGDRVAGERLFIMKGCVQCHMVRARGGRLGPELTRAGAARSIEYLRESIREPDKELSVAFSDPNNHYAVPVEWETVTAIFPDGRRVTGVAKNEDAFTLQLLGQDEKLNLFLKKDLERVVHERRSLMPAYTEKMLSEAEMRDLLAYLTSLRGQE